jgi:hypothetical protein
MVSAAGRIIQQHTDSVISGKIATPQGPCPRCSEQTQTFIRHDRRVRFFRFIVGNFVRVIKSLLVRWRCPICGKTFTDYPAFALPHKRYVLMDMERLSKDYVEDEQRTYRKTVCHQKMRIGYQGSDDDIDERFLEHSTPWRWISSLGSMKTTLNQVLHLISQKDPQSSIFREVFPVYPCKYRSLQRKNMLQNTRRLLRACQEFQRLFGHKIFPHLATAGSWN